MERSSHLILAHHPDSLSELPVFRQLIYQTTDYGDEPGHALRHGSRAAGWHILEVRYGLADGQSDWLGEMVTATRVPVMIVSFFEGELCTVRGLEPGPRASMWTVRLHAESAAARYPTPKFRHVQPGLPPEWMVSGALLGGDQAVDAIAGWSAAAGGEADREGLSALLAEVPESFTEDVFFRLLDLLGLGGEVEAAPYPHEVSTWDDPVKLEKSMAALQPGRYRALDCGEHQECYALVRMRPEGDYVIEYREEKPEVLYQTITPSLDKVVAAMQAWAQGDVLWRDDFAWTETTPFPR